MTARIAPAPCTLRWGKIDDLAFIVDSWTKKDPDMRAMRQRDSTRHVRTLLAREGSRVIVAHVPDDADAILGWAAVERECLHYVYVRSTARRQGIARAMLETVPIVAYSHRVARGLMAPSLWVYEPERADTAAELGPASSLVAPIHSSK